MPVHGILKHNNAQTFRKVLRSPFDKYSNTSHGDGTPSKYKMHAKYIGCCQLHKITKLCAIVRLQL